MSRDKRYQRLLNDKRWQEVKRIVCQRTYGLCERCREEGFITPGVDCHHIVPVETGRTEQEMERLAYDANNVRLLCVACHIKTHQELRSFNRENVQANKQRKRAIFLQRNDPNYQGDDEGKPAYTIEPISK